MAGRMDPHARNLPNHAGNAGNAANAANAGGAVFNFVGNALNVFQ